MVDITLRCECGKFQGVAKGVSSKKGLHIICMCDDCQAYAHYLGKSDTVLDAQGGTDIFQLRPPQLYFSQGQENLQCMRLSPKGMIRWYAGCCKTPIANTMAHSKVPFAGTVHSIMALPESKGSIDGVLGPAIRVQGRFGIGPLPPQTAKIMPPSLILKTIRFLLSGFLKGAAHPSPFFDQKGAPIRTPYILTSAERDALRPLCGPHPAIRKPST